MDELRAAVLEAVRGAGGSMAYRDLYESMPEQERRSLYSVLRVLKAEGVLRASVAFDPSSGTIQHTYQEVTS